MDDSTEVAATLSSDDVDRGYSLYRCYNAQGVLLYVGSSLGVFHRLESHRNGKSWWDTVAMVTIQRLGTSDKQEAWREERDAIKSELPRHNVIHNEAVVPRVCTPSESPSKLDPVSVRLEPELRAWLDRKAERENRTLSGMITHILRKRQREYEQT